MTILLSKKAKCEQSKHTEIEEESHNVKKALA